MRQKNPSDRTYTVLHRNGATGKHHFVGTFESVEAAAEYVAQTAKKSRSFMSFEIWIGTPEVWTQRAWNTNTVTGAQR